jgi:phosphoglycolate phosphatase
MRKFAKAILKLRKFCKSSLFLAFFVVKYLQRFKKEDEKLLKTIIFDLDGTLCDTLDDIRTGVNSMLVRLGYKTRTRAELLKAINNGARELVRRSLPKEVQKIDFIVDSALEIYASEYAKCYCQRTRAFDGIKNLLAELKSRDYKLAVLTNKQDAFAKTIIEKIFGKGVFNMVVGQGAYPAKPNPTSVLAIARALGSKPNLCVMIGDSDVDIKTGQNAQIETIGVCWGYREREVLEEIGADHLVERPEEILDIVDTIEARLQAEKDAKKLKKKQK